MATRGAGATMPAWLIGPTTRADAGGSRERLILLARVIIGFTIVSSALGLWLSTIDREPTEWGC